MGVEILVDGLEGRVIGGQLGGDEVARADRGAHPELRARLGKAAQAYIAKSHTYEAFSLKLASLYDWVKKELPVKEVVPTKVAATIAR